MSDIDWSKAPEGATHYNPDCVYPWLCATPAAYFIDGKGWMDYARAANAKRAFDGAVPRPMPQPEPVEWDGTGWPPVGTLVEVHRKGRNPGEGMVVAEHLGELVVWLGNKDYARMPADWLRPILTPEQRAAKERDEAVAAMLADADVVPFGSEREESMAQALYAAGWRKTEGA